MFKLKYSKIYKISLQQKVLSIKGPLGCNYLKIPKSICISNLEPSKVLVIKSISQKQRKSTNPKIKTFITDLNNSFRSVAFGTFETVELNGLGLSLRALEKNFLHGYDLYTKLGWSNDIIFTFSINRIRADLYKPAKKNTNLLTLYSSDYSYSRNTISNIVNCRQGKLKTQRSRFKRSRKNEGYVVKKII